jgi:uncharacterized protein (TIGR02266 family)
MLPFEGMPTGTISSLEAQSFERLRPRLSALKEPVSPPGDPRAVALRALVVVDSLEQPDVKARLAAAHGRGELQCVGDLREAARALLFVAAKQTERDEKAWRDLLARAWTHMSVLFEEVCRLGSSVPHDTSGVTLPSWPAVAHPPSRPEASKPQGQWQRSQRPGSASAPGPASAPRLPSVPRPPPVPKGMAGAVDRPKLASADFGPASGADVASLEPVRTSPRFNIALEVGIFSESNLYVGFTENMSAAGIFVATHVLRPIGTSIEVNVLFPGRAEPVRLHGEVRWLREFVPGSDQWPGMGIRFDGLSPAEDALMREFLRKRDPIFFDE